MEEIRARLAAAIAAMRALNDEIGDAEPTPEQQSRWEAAEVEQAAAQSALEVAERADRVRESRARWQSVQVGGADSGDRYAQLRQLARVSPHAEDWRGAEVVGSIVRAVEGRVSVTAADEAHMERTLRRHLCRTEVDPDHDLAATRQWARQLMIRCTPEYMRGFNRIMHGGVHAMLSLTPEERAAIAVGTNTSGGFLVPTHLDPTLILSNDGTNNIVRRISRVVTLDPGQGNVWHGITSAGATGSFDAEYAEVSDDTPAVAGPSVSLGMGRTFIKATFQAIEDIPDLATEVLTALADARDRLEGSAHCTGAGTNSGPIGIFTALDANTNVEIISDTAAAIAVADINEIYRTVPQRFRGRGQWLMNELYAEAIEVLGTAVGASYTGTLAQGETAVLKGRPWNRSDDCPETVTTTALDNELIYGDFSQFVIVDRPGSMSVEYIANLTSSTTGGLPTAERGWLAWWRNGSDSIVDGAFRMLQDKTSA